MFWKVLGFFQAFWKEEGGVKINLGAKAKPASRLQKREAN